MPKEKNVKYNAYPTHEDLNRESMTIEFHVKNAQITFLKRFLNDMKAVTATLKAAGDSKNVWAASMVTNAAAFDRIMGKFENCLVRTASVTASLSMRWWPHRPAPAAHHARDDGGDEGHDYHCCDWVGAQRDVHHATGQAKATCATGHGPGVLATSACVCVCLCAHAFAWYALVLVVVSWRLTESVGTGAATGTEPDRLLAPPASSGRDVLGDAEPAEAKGGNRDRRRPPARHCTWLAAVVVRCAVV